MRTAITGFSLLLMMVLAWGCDSNPEGPVGPRTSRTAPAAPTDPEEAAPKKRGVTPDAVAPLKRTR